MAKFEVTHREGKARVGKLSCLHGSLSTPLFFPVGTQASVKALSSEDLESVGTEAILANTYHLYLRPGEKTIKNLGGLQKFMHWEHPILTDSGGFQVFSLGFGITHEVGKMVSLYGENLVLGETLDSGNKEVVVRTKLCKVEEEGPTFQSHLDGSVHFFPPEKSVAVQKDLGADFIVALDECTSPLHDYDYTKTSMERSHRWEKRSLDAAGDSAMFGVVQGGPFADLRKISAKFVSDHDFFGVGIGGALVSKEKMREILDWISPVLDEAKPRHLLGIGTVDDIFEAVERGVDMFDCVAPTRLGRMGHVLSFGEERFSFDISKTIYKDDGRPLAMDCDCYSCQNYSRAYVHHLFRSHELLVYRLISVHNVRFMMKLMAEIREAIANKQFAKLKERWLQ